MTLSQLIDYTTGVLKLWFGNKSTLDKISESEDGNIVYNGKEIIDNSEQIKGLTNKVDNIKRYSKYINAELDSCFVKLTEDYSPVEGECLPFQKVSGSLEVKDGKIVLQPHQRVHLSLSLSYSDSTNEVFPDIAFSFKDFTNNIVIHTIPEFDFINFCQYSNDTNTVCEVGICVEKINTNDILNDMTTLTVQEINKIVIDPLDYVNETQGIEDTPVGHIINHMGNLAPEHYLICDGTEYSISDYPYLVQHFEEQFGAINYFGGDGTSTFCVPDLRGEFLRGTGTADRNTGSGSDVGIHQNGTSINNNQVNDVNNISSLMMTNAVASNFDTITRVNRITYSGCEVKSILSDGRAYTYTSRPTNTSILYCIKYEPTYYMNIVQNINTDPELQKIIAQLSLILDDINVEVI